MCLLEMSESLSRSVPRDYKLRSSKKVGYIRWIRYEDSCNYDAKKDLCRVIGPCDDDDGKRSEGHLKVARHGNPCSFHWCSQMRYPPKLEIREHVAPIYAV